jgi:hypothetical protein
VSLDPASWQVLQRCLAHLGNQHTTTKRGESIESVTASTFGEICSSDARNFVDATGDAILAMHSGAATRYGTDGGHDGCHDGCLGHHHAMASRDGRERGADQSAGVLTDDCEYPDAADTRRSLESV